MVPLVTPRWPLCGLGTLGANPLEMWLKVLRRCTGTPIAHLRFVKIRVLHMALGTGQLGKSFEEFGHRRGDKVCAIHVHKLVVVVLAAHGRRVDSVATANDVEGVNEERQPRLELRLQPFSSTTNVHSERIFGKFGFVFSLVGAYGFAVVVLEANVGDWIARPSALPIK